MKHLLSKAKQNAKDTIISSFFFHAQGVDLERFTLLSSTAVPSSAKQPYFSFAAKMLSQDDGINWTIRDLKHQLLSLIRLLNNRYVFFFIDALDECDQVEMEDMIPFLEHLGHSLNACDVHLRICLASRHYPQLNIERGIEWVLEYQQEHQGDMRKYVETKLRGGKSKMLQEIREEVCARASGVFLWVILVVRSLNDAFAKGQIHAVRQRLDEIPDGLDELFTDMLTRDTDEIDDLIFCLRLILFAQCPLSKDEIYFAVMFTKNGLIKREGEWHIDPHIENFILNVSKGLVEITRTKARIVHFIHESVRDFLLRRDGFSKLQAGSSANTIGNAHNELAQICFRYICQIKFMAVSEIPNRYVWPPIAKDKNSESETPFLNYAIHSLLPHSNAAEAGGTSQAAFLQAFSLSFQDFMYIRNALTQCLIRRYGAEVTPLYVLAELNLDHLIRLELLRTPQMWKQMGRYHSPMGAAVYMGNTLAIRALLGCNTSSDASVDNSLLEAGVIDRMKQYVVNSKRIQMKRHSMALCLVDHIEYLYLTGKIDLNHKLNCRSLPLIYAIKCSKAEIVEFLLSFVRVTIASPTNALHIAITRGKRDVCSVLLSSPYSLRWLDSYGGVAIHWAVTGNNGSTMRKLLELGCDVTLRDGRGRDALSHAAEQGKIEMMKILIESGVVDIDGKDGQGRTAFSWAAGPNSETLNRSPDPKKCWDQLQKEAMYVLLSTGRVDVNSRDKHQWTPLLWAVQTNKPVAVDILLEASGTEVDCRSVTGKFPLTVAAMCGHEAMLCKPLQSGRVDFSRKWQYMIDGISPHRAVPLLLGCPIIDASIPDSFGHPAWWWAQAWWIDAPAVWELEEEKGRKVMQLLIDHLSTKNKFNNYAVLPLDRETLKREIQVVAASYTPYDY
ncbi:ankyrin [Aspergillus eucalypticola CBS 122712]|uniref:Ankyrin n=1 Tax=Aspergillus eucalypticola (strain CBS 122712 / IBT 29274) TaxID=1448314 RepID=A0A317VH75_ASPEC|nr:ankyrin [Aspergillus eucalypticola CBS 122712]PWY71220.1 ankyrin [Aspergillus eucalypticola CBS 122712]